MMKVDQTGDDDPVSVSTKSKMTCKFRRFLWFLGAFLLVTFILFYSLHRRHREETLEVTLVTAYFNLGTFQKGTSGLYYTPDKYKTWFSVFSLIKNPVIFYLEKSSPLVRLIKLLRSKFPEKMTKIYEMDKVDMWSFKLIPRIAKIFSRAGYPKHPPNTVKPDYAAAMHAKYELMRHAINANPFDSIHFAWIDVGLFRELVPPNNTSQPFRLVLPKGLYGTQSIAYSKVFDLRPRMEASTIVTNNMVWVCGAYFVGRSDALWQWTAEYMDGVERMMNETNFTSTDQQIIYWMFSNKDQLHLKTDIKTYSGQGYNPWFYLGYVSRVYDLSN